MGNRSSAPGFVFHVRFLPHSFIFIIVFAKGRRYRGLGLRLVWPGVQPKSNLVSLSLILSNVFQVSSV